MADTDQEARDLKAVDDALEKLGEQFDSVQIFCTRQESSDIGTVHIAKGCGNFFARRGQVLEWSIKNDECSRVEARKKEEE